MTTINSVGNGLSGSAGSGAFAGATGITSWTPTFSFTTPGNISVSYASQVGNYVRIGNTITITFYLLCTPTFSTSSGVAIINGVPVAANSSGNTMIGSCILSGAAYETGTTQTSSAIAAGDAYIFMYASGSSTAYNTINLAQITSGVALTIYGTLTYIV